MQVAAIFDAGTVGKEFIKGLNEKEQTFLDDETGSVIWEFDDEKEAEKVVLALFKRVSVIDVIRAFIIGDDDEDMRQFLSL